MNNITEPATAEYGRIEDVQTWNGAFALCKAPLTIELTREAWHYAAFLPLPDGYTSRTDESHSLLLQVRLTVKFGTVAVAALHEDRQKLLTRDIIVRQSDLMETVTLMVDRPRDCSGIMIRSAAQSDSGPKVIIESIRFSTGTREELWRAVLSEEQKLMLDDYPLAQQIFAVVSWGCCATGWIAHVLNSHPDIFCVHAANITFQVLGNSPCLDGIQYMRTIGSLGYSHKAAGDVHGVSRQCIPELRNEFGSQFNAVVLMRDPLPRLRSQLALFAKYGGVGWDVGYVTSVIDELGLPVSKTDREKLLFIHGANMLNTILEDSALGTVYRSEDLTRNPESLARLVEEITGGVVKPESWWLSAAVQTGLINVHADDGVDPKTVDLDAWQVDLLQKIVKQETWDAYASLGYKRSWKELGLG